MREILFRAKAINRDRGYHRTSYKNGDWVYGLVTKLYDERFESLPAEMTDIDGISHIEVNYKTIGQYTGLLDKNGKKIFEGDILKYEEEYYLVKFLEYRWAAIYKTCLPDDLDQRTAKDFEKVGNIYDNPELLEG